MKRVQAFRGKANKPIFTLKLTNSGSNARRINLSLSIITLKHRFYTTIQYTPMNKLMHLRGVLSVILALIGHDHQ